MANRKLPLISAFFGMFHVEHWRWFYGKVMAQIEPSLSFFRAEKRQCSTWNIGSKVCISAFVFLFAFSKSKAQNRYSLLFESEKTDELASLLTDFEAGWIVKIPDTLVFLSAQKSEIATPLLQHCREYGYLVASIDAQNMVENDSTALEKLQIGTSYKWVNLRPKSDIERSWLRASDINFKKWNDEPIEVKVLLDAENRLLEQAENNGFPFAKVYLDSLEQGENGQLSAQLTLEKGPYFTFDALGFKSPTKLPRRYLEAVLGIREGDAFSRKRVLDIEKRLTELPFLELSESPKVRFSDNTAQIRLLFKEKKANRGDFLIGLLPQGGGSTRTIFTGSVDALFQNALNQGEKFALKLERLRPETQRADLKISLPYMLGQPFGGDFALHLHKRDSTFLDANTRIGAHYLFQNGDQFSVFWANNSSSLLRVDTQKVKNLGRLPEALDYHRNALGIGWLHNSLDYRLNPRSGFWLESTVSVGLNRTLRNSEIQNIEGGNTDFNALYDALKLNTTRFQGDFKAQFYRPIFLRSTVLVGLNGVGLFSNSPIYRNEQKRLGGTKSIRGFDEESIFATHALFGTVEYRLLLSRDAHLAAFSDYGYFENSTIELKVQQWLLSFGVGMALQTNGGQFTISIASGRANSANFDLRASKFHLGFLSNF